MKLVEEIKSDLNFNEPRVVLSPERCIVENVKSIVMISESALTVLTGKKYVTVNGSNFVIKEISEGRLLVEGKMQGIELLHASNTDKDRRPENR